MKLEDSLTMEPGGVKPDDPIDDEPAKYPLLSDLPLDPKLEDVAEIMGLWELLLGDDPAEESVRELSVSVGGAMLPDGVE